MIIIQTEFPSLFLAVILPILGSFALPFLEKKVEDKILFIIVFALLTFPLFIVLFLFGRFGLSEAIIEPAFFSHPYVGSFSMYLDSLNKFFVLGIVVVVPFVGWFSRTYIKNRIRRLTDLGEEPPSLGTFYFLYTVLSATMLGSVLSINVLGFYVFIELSGISTFLLIALYGYKERVKTAYMYLIWAVGGALILLFGIIGLGVSTGSFELATEGIQILDGGLERALHATIPVSIILGLLIKMASFGVHIWLPPSHAKAPSPISALLSPLLIGVSGYALIKIPLTFFPHLFQQISTIIFGLAFLTLIYGGFLALAQDNLKRLLAYSSISQMGWMLLGISTMTQKGIIGGALLYMAHAFGKSVLFMSAGNLIVQFEGPTDLSQLGGLASRIPATAGLTFFGFLFLVGMPPTLGFWSKMFIIKGAFGMFSGGGLIVSVLLSVGFIVAVGLTASYSFVTFKRIFFRNIPESMKKIYPDDWNEMTIPMAIIVSIGVFLFFLPMPLLGPLTRLLQPNLFLIEGGFIIVYLVFYHYFTRKPREIPMVLYQGVETRLEKGYNEKIAGSVGWIGQTFLNLDRADINDYLLWIVLGLLAVLTGLFFVL